MSSNYNANQFNEPFIPKRLQNWNSRTKPSNYPSQCSHPINFVADDKGHLFPHTRNSRSSPWGDYCANIWEEDEQKKKLALTEAGPKKHTVSKKPIIPRFFKRKPVEPNLPEIPRNGHINRRSDPIIQSLREAHVPIIWIVGLPTRKILHSRRLYAKQLAEQLNFTYINLDEQIAKWKQREEDGDLKPKESKITSKMAPKKTLEKYIAKMTTSVPLKLAQNLSCIDFTSLSAYELRKPSVESSRNVPKMLRPTLVPPWRTDQQANPIIYKQQLTSEIRSSISSSDLPKIHFSIGGERKFTRDSILELLKNAMIEYWPATDGYIIEGFPYDIGDAIHFETMFYPITLGIYFTESDVTSTISTIETEDLKRAKGWNQSQRLPTGQVKIHCINTSGCNSSDHSELENETCRDAEAAFHQTSAPVIPIGPKYAKRNKSFSFQEAQKLCNLFGSKIVRVINAESILVDTMGFVHSIVKKYLSKLCPNIPLSLTDVEVDFEYDYEKSPVPAIVVPEAKVKAWKVCEVKKLPSKNPKKVCMNSDAIVQDLNLKDRQERVEHHHEIPEELKMSLRHRILSNYGDGEGQAAAVECDPNFMAAYESSSSYDGVEGDELLVERVEVAEEELEDSYSNSSFDEDEEDEGEGQKSSRNRSHEAAGQELYSETYEDEKPEDFIVNYYQCDNFFDEYFSSSEDDGIEPTAESNRNSGDKSSNSIHSVEYATIGDSILHEKCEDDDVAVCSGCEGDAGSGREDEKDAEDGGFTNRYKKAMEFDFSDYEREFTEKGQNEVASQLNEYSVPNIPTRSKLPHTPPPPNLCGDSCFNATSNARSSKPKQYHRNQSHLPEENSAQDRDKKSNSELATARN